MLAIIAGARIPAARALQIVGLLSAVLCSLTVLVALTLLGLAGYFAPQIAQMVTEIPDPYAIKVALVSEIFEIAAVQRALTSTGIATLAAAFFAMLIFVGLYKIGARLTQSPTFDPPTKAWLKRVPIWMVAMVLCALVARSSFVAVNWQAFAGI